MRQKSKLSLFCKQTQNLRFELELLEVLRNSKIQNQTKLQISRLLDNSILFLIIRYQSFIFPTEIATFFTMSSGTGETGECEFIVPIHCGKSRHTRHNYSHLNWTHENYLYSKEVCFLKLCLILFYINLLKRTFHIIQIQNMMELQKKTFF